MQESHKEQFRYFLKDSIRQTIDFEQTDQHQGIAPPPIEKAVPPDAKRLDLLPPAQWTGIPKVDLLSAIQRRKSHRRFQKQPFTLEELAFLLWTTHGITHVVQPGTAFRTVPSAGCRHALETYLCILNVKGLEMGIYRYLPVEHQLMLEFHDDELERKIIDVTLGQKFTGRAAVTFFWTTIPYRMEWRYDAAAYKVIALDAGHVCQNLYLSCEAIEAGCCAIAAYNQVLADALLKLDGQEEFNLYLAAAGKI
ncbi:thioester oxidase [candidate division KSB3 bacterium]|uniref:Thioester oxidase n=1 Tax=candidate division KSB3 bacterium TaxID=2044937 RepID=A0A2G6E267_9BACT|nr:MAG: thioester oxidase [candidate division KSB3 bacterium]PIE28698.1 MAG: thioester oxidase [candidate division KSB3 bacterium]